MMGAVIISESVELLKRLIATESYSRNEAAAADIVAGFLSDHNCSVERHLNNIYSRNTHFQDSKPTLLLNSHLDTVRPNKDWQRNPFEAVVENDKLYGLGSNDAGASLVTLAACFISLNNRTDLPFNIIYAATAEEEISGADGIAALVPIIPRIDFAIVGEPTEMKAAVAEKGLMVLRCTARGRSGHAARNEGVNAIDIASRDIQWIHNYRFVKESRLLGPVKMTVTIISAGTQHNVIPAECSFTVDVRSTDAYSNEETLDIIRENILSEIGEVSKRLQPSRLDNDHPLMKAVHDSGLESYGSPTLSDQALLHVPSLKMGPGSSSRSHTADEYVLISELYSGFATYISFLQKLAAATN
jgi:acetylornithine deacetylase